ncbi:MAG: hypothetical protein JNL43_05160 [Flavobacteriales bacterium]|nr:hypothetical protein [Flavobacteriales bacterium]HRH71345.1 DUF5777 family beta-barrel protein [Flavobacteriales bacterium]
MTRIYCLVLALGATPIFAQEDLLDLLGADSTSAEPEYTSASFKTTRVINGHSLENTAHGVLDFKIGHRFGPVNGGIDEFYGLDDATIRLGLDYGLTDRLMIGIGRSSYQKTVDGFAKYKFLRQCDAGCTMPVTLAVLAASSITTMPEEDLTWYDPTRTVYFTNRMSYAFSVIVGRKFSERFTLQLNPGLVHRNLVSTNEEKNDVIHVSGAGRVKLSKRVALNAEYFYVLPDQIDPKYYNSLSIGFDIETGGHVFQLHMSNSTGLYERAFITETTDSWADGGIRFGFNISRVFTLHDPKQKVAEKARQGY